MQNPGRFKLSAEREDQGNGVWGCGVGSGAWPPGAWFERAVAFAAGAGNETRDPRL